MKLDNSMDEKVEYRAESNQEQRIKLVDQQRYYKGLGLYAFNSETGEVYKVPIQVQQEYDVMKKVQANYKAIINPEHPHVYALNNQNAMRKFANFLKSHGLI